MVANLIRMNNILNRIEGKEKYNKKTTSALKTNSFLKYFLNIFRLNSTASSTCI